MTRNDIIAMLLSSDSTQLMNRANSIRDEVHGRQVHLRAIIETSSHCRADCQYCGLRRSNVELPRYRMTDDDVAGVARNAVLAGFETVVLQSGEDSCYSADCLADLTSLVHDTAPTLGLTLSFGEWPVSTYAQWQSAGADRYLLKFETSRPTLFSNLRPGRTLSGRLDCLRAIREAGLQMGTGFMVGLPGQTISDLANDLLLLRDLDPDMAGIGPFIPHPQTPLADADMRIFESVITPDSLVQHLDRADLTLRSIAIARLLCPSCHLPGTTALGTIDPSGWKKALEAGANVLMKDITPPAFSAAYDIYPGRPVARATPHDGYRLLATLVAEAGLSVASGVGHSVRERKPRTACVRGSS